MPTGITFQGVTLVTLTPNTDVPVVITAGRVWKIESAGIGGTNGVIYLKNATDKIAILFSSIGDDDFASPMPFWLDSSFTGSFRNESGFKGVVSITEYSIP